MHGCADHRRTSRRRLLGTAPGALVPVPADLLSLGGERFVAQGRTRRDFLVGGVGAMLALTAASRLQPWEVVAEAAAAAAGSTDPILVSLYLGGGNDGLNTLVPLTGADHAAYWAARPRLRIDPATTLPVAGGDLGWHPQAAGFRTLHDRGELAAYLGVDYPAPDYSHFQSAYYWRTGQVGHGPVTGWLGNYLDRHGSRDNPLQGVAVEWSADEVLRTARAPTCAVFSPTDDSWWSPDVWDDARLFDAYRSLIGTARSPARARAMAVAAQSVYVRDHLKALRAEATPPPPPTPYPVSDTGKALANLARMLGAGLGIRVATVLAAGAFDTHRDQAKTHGDDLADVADALVAFQDDLHARGLADRVVTIVWSEFGRRIADNESGGTDHGAGSSVLVVGNRVRGGLSGTWNLAGAGAYDGSIPVAVDFRDLYATALGWLDTDPEPILGKGFHPQAILA